MKYAISLFTVFLFFSLAGQFSGNTDIEVITKKQGLSDAYITGGVTEDTLGYLWIGTIDGVNRYNGLEFEIFRPETHDSLRERIIRGIFRDRKGRLWIKGTDIYRYDDKHNRFIPYPTPTVPNRNESLYHDIFDDSEGNIWTQYAKNLDGIVKLDPSTKKYTNLAILGKGNLDFSDIERVKLLAIDESNQLWLSVTNTDGSLSLLVCRYRNNVISDVQMLSTQSRMHERDPRPGLLYCKTSDNLRRIFSWDGTVYTYNPLLKKLEKDKDLSAVFNPVFGQNPIIKIQESINRHGWLITTFRQCYLFAEGKLFPLIHLSSDILSIYQDRNELIWLGTISGLIKINSLAKKFYSYIPQPSSMNNAITALTKDKKGNLWISTYNGLFIVSPDGKTIHLTKEKLPAHIMVNNHYNTMIECLNGDMLCGGIGINRINPFKETYLYAHPDSDDSNSLNAWVVWHIIKGKKTGYYYIATHNGSCRIVPGNGYAAPSYGKMTESFERLIIYPPGIESENVCFCIYEDHEGMIWHGLKKGLARYNPYNKNIKFFLPEKNNPSSINCNTASCIMEDSRNRLWIGTEEGGLNLFDRKTETFTHFTTREGLASNMVWGIVEDNHGNLWISTNNGLSKFNPDSKVFINFGTADGLPDNEFTRGCYYKDSEGRLYFGTLSGVVHFHPDSILINTRPPEGVIDKLYLFGKPVQPGEKINGEEILPIALPLLKEISLSWKNNTLSFGFSALHFVTPAKNRYSYKLEGFDTGWNYTGSHYPMANYTNLPPGDYVLRLRVANNDGIWNPKETTLKIHIRPPFWMTWWFKTMVIILAGGLVLFFIQYRMTTFRKKELAAEVAEKTKELTIKKNELERINETKDRFIRIISHDLKSPFQAITGMSELLLKEFPNIPDDHKQEMIQVIHKASESASSLLENLLLWSKAHMGKWTYTPETFDLQEAIAAVFNVVLPQARKKQIHLINALNRSIPVCADRSITETVIRNLVTNAIKFTLPKGRVLIEAKETGNQVEIAIEDNGVGMNEEMQKNLYHMEAKLNTRGTAGESGTGLGLILCKEMLEITGSQLFFESKEGKGSRFWFYLSKA